MQIGLRIFRERPDNGHMTIMTPLRMPPLFTDIAAGVLLDMPKGKRAVALLSEMHRQEYVRSHEDNNTLFPLASDNDHAIIAPNELWDIFGVRNILLIIKQTGERYLCVNDEEIISALEHGIQLPC